MTLLEEIGIISGILTINAVITRWMVKATVADQFKKNGFVSIDLCRQRRIEAERRVRALERKVDDAAD